MDRLSELTDAQLREAHREYTKRRVWPIVANIERELKNRAPVELAQDSYYYGTAADLRGER